MKKINKSRYAILGMLFDKSMTGYEIKKFMQESTTHFWQESDASIYPMLKKLAAEGKVLAQITRKGKLERMRYTITNTGKKEFTRWMEQEAEPGTHRDEFLLKLFFGASSSPSVIIKHLKAKQAMLQELLKKYAYVNMFVLDKVTPDNPHKLFWQMALRNGIISAEAELKWIDEYLKMLK
jgi:DNA-binding PadR family transcriptional regulator